MVWPELLLLQQVVALVQGFREGKRATLNHTNCETVTSSPGRGGDLRRSAEPHVVPEPHVVGVPLLLPPGQEMHSEGEGIAQLTVAQAVTIGLLKPRAQGTVQWGERGLALSGYQSSSGAAGPSWS